MKRHFGVWILLLLLAQITFQPAAAQVAPEMALRTLTHDGLERTYHLFVPESLAGAESIPLMIALHPISSSGLAMAAMTGLSDAAAEAGFAVVYPNSARLYWDDGRTAADIAPNQGAVDDLGFLTALIDELTATSNIDPEQIYLVGMDNGGGLALRYACQNPERLAGVAGVGILMWEYHFEACPAETTDHPLNVLLVNGANDTYYPINGRSVDGANGRIVISSVAQTVGYWAQRTGCDAEAVGTYRAREGETAAASYIVFESCPEEVLVAGYVISGAGHEWADAGIGALNSLRVDTTALILDFFTGEENWGVESIVELGEEVQPISLPRNYRAYVPTTYDPQGEPLPLVIALHGRPDNGIGISYITDLNSKAEAEGFIAAYPDGIDNGWFYAPRAEDQLTDVGFLLRMVDELKAELNVDAQRIYVTGFSNGGFMTQSIACGTEGVFAAYAVVAATLYPGIEEDCADASPVPILFMHGTLDNSIPWEGQVAMSPGGLAISGSVPETIEFWGTHNGCDAESDTRIDVPQSDEAIRVGIFPFTGCEGRGALRFYAIDGGGHNWPGNPGRIPAEIEGPVTVDINATDEIWDFLSQFSLPQ
ncbi:MAG: hypothetical protein OHK0046_32890 [Anaerolineae bacterium]